MYYLKKRQLSLNIDTCRNDEVWIEIGRAETRDYHSLISRAYQMLREDRRLVLGMFNGKGLVQKLEKVDAKTTAERRRDHMKATRRAHGNRIIEIQAKEKGKWKIMEQGPRRTYNDMLRRMYLWARNTGLDHRIVDIDSQTTLTSVAGEM